MNHTERINETARHHRHLTRRMAKEAIETYLDLLAKEAAGGEPIDLPGMGKIEIIIEEGSGILYSRDGMQYQVKRRLRTKIRLFEVFKRRCYMRKSQ